MPVPATATKCARMRADCGGCAGGPPASFARVAPWYDGGVPTPERPPREPASPIQRVGLVLGLAALATLALVPSDLHRIEGLGHRPAYAAGVAALMAIWWLTEAAPMAVTACAPLVLYPLLGVFGQGPAGDVVASAEPFADAYIFLFLGGMTIGAAMEQWRLHRRVALHIMRAIGTEPRRLLAGLIASTAAVSMWISNTATAVMMMPIGLAVLRELEAARGRRLPRFGCALMLAVAYASNVGGIGTKIGTGTNSIFAGFVADKLHRDIGFLEYIALGTPFVLVFLPLVYVALWRHARGDDLGREDAGVALDRELAAMGPMRGGEKAVAAVFTAAAALWILGDPIRAELAPRIAALAGGFAVKGKHYEASVAMAAALALVAGRLVSLATLRRVPWSALVLLGGSFAMAAGIEGSGLGKWMAGELSGLAALPPLPQIALATFATIALSAVASNTATINVALNVLPPSLPLLSASMIGASCDFMLPAGTPPNAIVVGSGHVHLPTMIRVGFALDVAAGLVVTVYCHFYAAWLLG
jgi:sodium-dependent dicarboxylate transporter 2/3/5